MNKKELLEYEKACGTESAINLLLLTPPDQFEDDYDETMKELEDYNTTYILYTGDGDKWEYDTLDEARRTQYIFGGTIIKKGGNNDDNSKE